ncbi:hypothetical protein LCGC14_1752480 [marine sediment metagenome]|uniref:Uncharacterized protein n=1 Tax=marine sediment metagenome TaxID=412755 RepID=A0A0F9H3E9_9ZZZZ
MDELLERARELLDEYDDVAIHAVTIDHNVDLAALAAIITGGLVGGANLLQLINGTKSTVELAFYLGYLAGKEEGNLSIWEDQL